MAWVGTFMRAGTKWCALAALTFGAGLVANAAWAQERVPPSNGDGMDTHLFRPAVDSKGFFAVDGSEVLGARDYSFGLILDYGRNLIRTNPEREEAGGEALVPHSFQGTFGFNYGLGGIAIVGLRVPVLLMSGDPVNRIGPNDATYDSGQLDLQTIGSPVLLGKLRILGVERGLGLAAVMQVGAPRSSAARELGADPGLWYWPQAVVEADPLGGRKLRLAVNGGFRGHTGDDPWFGADPLEPSLPQLEEGELRYGNLATFGGALSVRVLPVLDLVAETYGTYLMDERSAKGQRLSEEFLGGIKLFIEENSYFMLGGGGRAMFTGFQAADARLVLGFVFEPSVGDSDGDGYKDNDDECPMEPEDFDGFEDSDGCPDPDNDKDGIPDDLDRCPNIPEDFDGDRDHDGCPDITEKDSDGDGIIDAKDACPLEPEDRDGYKDDDGCPDPDNDGDGIPDVRDQCPTEAEDRDGFEDEDGCPDLDNDQDRIPDAVDRCPMEPETYNGVNDEDGCPDKGSVVIEGSELVTLEQIQFETGSARIRPESMPLVEEVATILRDHPEFDVIEVAGHADERGSDAFNLRLTTARARSVVQALVERGVPTTRLVSQGYGEYCPLDAASTPEAWEKNRRVEFQIVKQDGSPSGVDRGCPDAAEKGILPPELK